MRSAWPLVVVALLATVCLAQAQLQLAPQYHFEVGAQLSNHLSARIDNVQMGTGVPLAVTGSADADVTLSVLAVDDQGVATIQARFGEVAAELMGEARPAETLEPAELQVDRLGCIVGATGGPPAGDVDLFASGGIPVHVVVLLAGVVELPEAPVSVGESWVSEREQDVPGFGEVTLVTTSRLESIADGVATVSTDLQASLPDFTARNPVQDGDITVRNGVLAVEGMERTIDLATGLTASARGAMSFDCMAAVGDFGDLPLALTSSFSMEPVAAPAGQAQAPVIRAPQTAPAAPAQPRTPSFGAWVARTVQGYLVAALNYVRRPLARQ